MKIELKDIKYSPTLSEDSVAFTARLYINDQLEGTVKNSGQGGNTFYDGNTDVERKLIKEAEIYCKTLPDIVYPSSSGSKDFTIPSSLENCIDDLLTRHLDAKHLEKVIKRLDKAIQGGIVFGDPNREVKMLAFKMPIAQILMQPNGYTVIKKTLVNDVLPHLKTGEMILNTNLPEQLLKDAGLKEGEYVKPNLSLDQKANKKKGPQL